MFIMDTKSRFVCFLLTHTESTEVKYTAHLFNFEDILNQNINATHLFSLLVFTS